MINYSFDENGNELPQKSKSVTEINEYIKWLIDGEMQLQDLYVVGELSNFKRHSSGHCYFSLKDENSEIRAIMFSRDSRKLKFIPENGMKILVHARIGVYTQGGSYQLYVDSMQPDGLGSLHLAFEQLKVKLASEGLFDEYHKKTIPKYPNSIGVITSPTGAAIRDIINVCSRRNPSIKLILYPTLVQGTDAPAELIKAVEYFNIEKNVDVLIIGRGGGSIEDLWAFNDEGLARAIYNSEIPVISGVGHEIDFTICDFVADIRAATPSAAAEIATTDIKAIYSMLENFEKKAYNAISSKINSSRDLLKRLASCKMLNKPESMLEIPKIKLLTQTNNLKMSILDVQKRQKERFAEINAKLVALNPMAVLSRGYGAIYKENKIVKSVNDVTVGEKITIKMSDGTINAIVSKGEENG